MGSYSNLPQLKFLHRNSGSKSSCVTLLLQQLSNEFKHSNFPLRPELLRTKVRLEQGLEPPVTVFQISSP